MKLKLNKNLKVIKYLENDKILIEKYILKFKPQQIYILSGLSSVRKSFLNPIETYKSNIIKLFEILEICRKKNYQLKFIIQLPQIALEIKKKNVMKIQISHQLVHMLNQKVLLTG